MWPDVTCKPLNKKLTSVCFSFPITTGDVINKTLQLTDTFMYFLFVQTKNLLET